MMKKNFYFGALLCGAMLASCSVKEDLRVEVAPANESPVFSVAMDGDAATRADLVLENAKVSFVETDKMSLYHGIETLNLTGYENAVYEGYAGSDENAMEFVTRAMVKKGFAVMVYPADLTFANEGTSAPQISIDLKGQTKETADNTPYVSEILEIKSYDEKDTPVDETAGYGRKYDLLMKRLASTLLLTLKEDGKAELPAGVAPLAVTGVEINAYPSNSENAKVFTETVVLKAGNEIVKPKEGDEHPMWINQVDVDVETAGSTIKTKYVENNVAVFTMLPFASSAATNIIAPTITVYTNYGSVTISGLSTNKNVWIGDSETENGDGTIVSGLRFLANNFYGEVSKNSGFYNTETGATQTKTGKAAKRTLLVDYSNLDMNGTHITSSEQLIDVLKVYDALAKNDDFNTKVEFFLDGDEDGKFYMTEDALKAYTAHIGRKSDITFTPCTDNGEECEIVVLTTEAGAEVPVAIDFSSDVVVELDGAWTFAGEHAFNGVSEVVVPDGSTVTLSGTVAVATTPAITNAYAISDTPAVITVEEGGVVAVAAGKTVTVKDFETTNYGTINVPAASALLMNDISLTNSYTAMSETAAKKANVSGYATLLSEGVINVEGRLASVNNGQINNLGVVNMKSADAYIYLTSNATNPASYGTAFTTPNVVEENVFGSVVLFDKTANENVNINGAQGFIKLELNQATVTDKDLGSIANYAILNGAIEVYDALTVGEKETVQNKIKYLEVNSTKQVKIVGKYANSNGHLFDGLWVREGSNVNIPTGSQVTVRYAYLQGYVYCAGTWYDGVKYKTYFGNGNEDHFAYTGK